MCEFDNPHLTPEVLLTSTPTCHQPPGRVHLVLDAEGKAVLEAAIGPLSKPAPDADGAPAVSYTHLTLPTSDLV